LPAHLDRLQLRISALVASTPMPDAVHACLGETLRELDRLRGSARVFRGATREAVLDALRALDARLMDVALGSVAPEARAGAEARATALLRPFESRLDADAWRDALARATRQAVREQLGLPTLALE
jgi:hypothetical protein